MSLLCSYKKYWFRSYLISWLIIYLILIMILYKTDSKTSSTVIGVAGLIHTIVHLFIVCWYKNEECRLETAKQIANDYNKVKSLYQQ